MIDADSGNRIVPGTAEVKYGHQDDEIILDVHFGNATVRQRAEIALMEIEQDRDRWNRLLTSDREDMTNWMDYFTTQVQICNRKIEALVAFMANGCNIPDVA